MKQPAKPQDLRKPANSCSAGITYLHNAFHPSLGLYRSSALNVALTALLFSAAFSSAFCTGALCKHGRCSHEVLTFPNIIISCSTALHQGKLVDALKNFCVCVVKWILGLGGCFRLLGSIFLIPVQSDDSGVCRRRMDRAAGTASSTNTGAGRHSLFYESISPSDDVDKAHTAPLFSLLVVAFA